MEESINQILKQENLQQLLQVEVALLNVAFVQEIISA